MLAVWLLLMTTAAARAEDTAAYGKLRAASRFAVGHVGYAGVTSDEELALRDVLSRRDASVDLRKLLSEATLAGQLYALWGLAVTADADFPKLSEKYDSIDAQVETMNGCLVEREAVSVIVERIRRGKYGKPAK